jgi:hypothetical protein
VDFLATVPFDCDIDPKLVRMDELLDDPKLILAVTNDLARSAPAARWNGRPALPVEVTLRLAVARRLTPAPTAGTMMRGLTRTHENGAYHGASGWCEVDAHWCHEPEPQADPTT